MASRPLVSSAPGQGTRRGRPSPIASDKGRCHSARPTRLRDKSRTRSSGAHARNVIHRDLKTANIIHVLDFGLAKIEPAATEDAATPIFTADTRQGVVLGTAAYMSPEQARGRPVDNEPTSGRLAVLYRWSLDAPRSSANDRGHRCGGSESIRISALPLGCPDSLRCSSAMLGEGSEAAPARHRRAHASSSSRRKSTTALEKCGRSGSGRGVHGGGHWLVPHRAPPSSREPSRSCVARGSRFSGTESSWSMPPYQAHRFRRQ